MKNGLISELFCLLVSLVLIFGANSCGTILYPERRGQTTGKIDVAVVLLSPIRFHPSAARREKPYLLSAGRDFFRMSATCEYSL